MALVTCPFCGKLEVSNTGECPACGGDIAEYQRNLKEIIHIIRSEFTCPECGNTYTVRTIDGTDYHDGVIKGRCVVCGYAVFEYIRRHTCIRCGELSEDSLKTIRTYNGSNYGPYCDSCYSQVCDALYPPTPNPYYDELTSSYDWDMRTD